VLRVTGRYAQATGGVSPVVSSVCVTKNTTVCHELLAAGPVVDVIYHRLDIPTKTLVSLPQQVDECAQSFTNGEQLEMLVAHLARSRPYSHERCHWPTATMIS
jgi:hypothetical protein